MEKILPVIDTIGKLIEWLPKIFKTFQPLRPEPTHFQINYRKQEAILHYKLNIESSKIKRKFGKIEIPKLPNYKIESFYGEGFSNLTHLLHANANQNSYIISTKQLPSCNSFQVILKGDLNKKALDDFIRIQPATNKNSTNTFDRYWLDVMIKDLDTLEQMYKYLLIDEVVCPVKILIERYFTTELPKSLTESIKAMNEYLAAGRSLDRHKLFQKWRKYYGMMKRDKDDLFRYFEEMIESLKLDNFIKIEEPFYPGNIGDFERFNAIPQNFIVEALINLSFQKPAASGYLQFNKKRFQDTIKKEIEDNWT